MKLFKLHTLFALFLLVVLFALPFAVAAQEGEASPELPTWALGLPTILVGLVSFNLKTTEWFKRILSSENLGWTPPKNIQGVLVLMFSVLLGIGSAWVVPNATSWLGDTQPLYAVILTGFTVSVVGGAVYEVLGRLAPSKAVYEQTTKINTPSSDTPPSTAKETMAAVSQAAKS